MASRLEKVYQRVFESNGEPSIIDTLKNHEEDIRSARIEAGEAKIQANRVRKYCGLKETAEPQEGQCAMLEIAEFIAAVKKVWKQILIVGLLIFFAVFITSAYNGWETSKKMTNVVKELTDLKTALGH